MRSWGPGLKVPFVVAVTFLVHETLLRGVFIDGVHPDLLLCLTVAAGAAAGAERGAIIGFTAGMLADLFLPTPLGLSALVYCLLGFLVGTLQDTVLPASRSFVPLTGMAGSAAGVVGFAMVGSLIGVPNMVTSRLVAIVAVIAVVNAVASRPLTRALAWAFEGGVTSTAPPSSPYAQ
jgi:rod shape-determining protein MreD